MKLLFGGGGTGGHITPGRNLARCLCTRGGVHEVRFLTSGRNVEDLFFEGSEWTRRPLFPGHDSRPSLLDPRPWLKAFGIAKREVAAFDPDAVILLGGYAALPLLLALRGSKKPLYTLEVNALPGRATRVCTYFARRVFCRFEETARRVGSKSKVSGSFLAPGFGRGGAPREAIQKEIGLDPGLLTLMVAGGSLGARAINRCGVKLLAPLLDRIGAGRVQVLHITGTRDFDMVRDEYGACNFPVSVISFMDPMEKAYLASDMILCRGGGMTLAEISAVGLRAVIVPYPHHRDRHQFHNAKEMIESGGAQLLEEKDISSATLCSTLLDVLLSPSRLASMSENARRDADNDGCRDVLDVIVEDLEKV